MCVPYEIQHTLLVISQHIAACRGRTPGDPRFVTAPFNTWYKHIIMLNIRIICVGKLKERFYTDAANEFIKRLAGYCKPEITEVSEYRLQPDRPNTTQIEQALEKERAAITLKLPPGALTIALCVEGREMDSPGLSEFLSECAVGGTSHLCFIIGGSFGLHEDIKNNAGVKLSMSKMTFPHNLARVILLEQLYRAFKIIEGGKYHK